jgi:type I restriction enzyme S subunit
VSRIDDLIAKLCPDGVQFRTLADCVVRPEGIRWSERYGEEFQYIDLTSVDRVTHAIVDTSKISSEDAPSRAQQIVRSGDVIFGTTRPLLKRYAIIPAEYDGQVCSSGFCVLRPNTELLLTNYLFHLLGTRDFYEYVAANERGASYPAIPDSLVRAYRIPTPPLAVQREIGDALDAFIALDAELEAELEGRRSQYTFYRNQLLEDSAAAGVRRVPMGELCTIVDGTHQTPRYTEHGVPFVSVENIASLGTTQKYISVDDFETQYKVKPQTGDLLMTRIGSIGVCAVVENDNPLAYYVTLALVRPKTDDLNARYLKQVIEGRVGRSELWKRTLHAAVPIKINLGDISRVLIPVPPRQQQDHVVRSLSSFEALVNDLSFGLPAELKARRQQYEHYRDRLLTFPEAA